MDKTKEIAGKTRSADAAGSVDIIEAIGQFGARITNIFSWVAVAGLILMMFLTCFNVIMRSIPGGFSITGIYEITGYLGSVVVGFAVAYTQLLGGHIAIDWIVARFPVRAQSATRVITSIAGAALFLLVAWQSWRFAGDLWQNNEVSPTAKIPFFPFVYAVAVACLPAALLLVVDALKAARKAVRG